MRAEEAAHEKVLRLAGRFDVDAARSVRDALLETGEDDQVVVDLRAAPTVEPTALAVLAACLGERHGCGVRVLGLTVQQARMLRYLGADVGPDGAELGPDGPGTGAAAP